MGGQLLAVSEVADAALHFSPPPPHEDTSNDQGRQGHHSGEPVGFDEGGRGARDKHRRPPDEHRGEDEQDDQEVPGFSTEIGEAGYDV